MIEEHQRIVLVSDLPSEALKAGDVGTVVHVYPDRRAYEVEFVALDGATAAVATVEAAMVRAVGADERSTRALCTPRSAGAGNDARLSGAGMPSGGITMTTLLDPAELRPPRL